MSIDVDDTIAAIATAPGPAARGIVRLSGPRMMACLEACLDWIGDPPQSAAGASCCEVSVACQDPVGNVPADVYLWPSARSYTRQPSAELHLPGSRVVLEAVLATLCESGARLATAGEFTLRAFLAGRLNLTQAEAVLGVIEAVTPDQLACSLDQLAGGLAAPLSALREQLLELLTELEAGLDFVEEDIEFISRQALQQQLAEACSVLDKVAQQFASRRLQQPVCRIVLCGAANAGKSTLFNRLLSEDSALVSDQPGTTRDYVCQEIQLGPFPCLLIDTAGSSSGDASRGVEQRAEQLAAEQLEQADLVLFCLDGSQPVASDQRELMDRLSGQAGMVLVTKSDLQADADTAQLGLAVSAARGDGLDQLRQQLLQQLVTMHAEQAAGQQAPLLCADAIRQAEESLTRSAQLAAEGAGEELVAAELRGTLDGLGQLLGNVYSDDILDRLFSRFCIGK
jgi:tRNA modification GTPase